jgi:hypothetical protein
MKQAKPQRRTPGYEPARGFPDPNFKAPPATRDTGAITHLPQSNGTVCNLLPPPTDASAYDPIAPTCPPCANYLKETKKVTAARHPEANAAADTEPPPPTPRDKK